MSVGENIKLKRESLGMSRTELIDKSGVSIAQLSRMERGEQNNPNLETLVAISTALNTSIDEMVFGEQSTSSIYLSKTIDSLPIDKKTFIKDVIKMAVMISSSERLEQGLKEKKKIS